MPLFVLPLSINISPSAPVAEIIANDFHLRKAQENVDASDVAQVFSQAQMQGKQVWYFTAPASIPIEVVEKLEIPLERAQKGLSILSHNGDDYGVAFEDASTTRSIKLLIPNKAGDKYGMRECSPLPGLTPCRAAADLVL